ncbi:MAG TPA: peptidase M49 [Myxococcota bacterium]|jgi:dipeptidyl-peptidase-3|nr:peptidase M49 [Myxococcota bacterium]
MNRRSALTWTAAAVLLGGAGAALAGAPAEKPDPEAKPVPKVPAAAGAVAHPHKLPVPPVAATKRPAKKPGGALESVGDVALVPLDPTGFEALPLEKKILAWHLAEAAWAGDRIVLDQNNAHNTAIRDLVAEIVAHPKGIPKPVFKKLRDYLVRLYVHHGVHDGWSAKKFTPDFTPEELAKAAATARAAGAHLCDSDDDCLPSLLAGLKDPIFNADFEPLRTVKDPPPGKDILTASSNNFYEGVTLDDLKGFTERYPLNSKLVKKDGKLVELVYRAGGTVEVLDAAGKPTGKAVDIPAGLYATELAAVIGHLEAALPYADPSQREALTWLVRYFRTGDLADFDRYNVAWVKDGPVVETINGFIESYVDARGAKASYESIVAMVDEPSTRVMRDLAAHALDFEKKMPWKDEYKKTAFTAPVANAFSVLVEAGDGGPLSAVGINLPNAQAIREKYGHKNFLLTNVMAARRDAFGFKAIDEFSFDKREADEGKRCYEPAGSALVAMHEVTGHGSGKVSPKLKADPSDYLKEYYSTLEEARADLVALWLAHDELALSLGVLPDAACADAMFQAFVRGFLLRLRTIPTGDAIEEDHLRAESLIIRWAMEKGAVAEVHRSGKVITDVGDVHYKDAKVYLRVLDAAKMRAAVGELLAELMRIKGEGDYEAIKALVTKHGSKLDPVWRDDAVARGKKLKLPVLAAVLPAVLTPVEKDGKIVDVLARPAGAKDVLPFALRAGAVPEIPPPAKSAAAGPPGGPAARAVATP